MWKTDKQWDTRAKIKQEKIIKCCNCDEETENGFKIDDILLCAYCEKNMCKCECCHKRLRLISIDRD